MKVGIQYEIIEEKMAEINEENQIKTRMDKALCFSKWFKLIKGRKSIYKHARSYCCNVYGSKLLINRIGNIRTPGKNANCLNLQFC